MDFTSQILLPVSLGVRGRGKSKCVALWYLVAGWGYSSTMCIHIYNWAPLAYFGSIKMVKKGWTYSQCFNSSSINVSALMERTTRIRLCSVMHCPFRQLYKWGALYLHWVYVTFRLLSRNPVCVGSPSWVHRILLMTASRTLVSR